MTGIISPATAGFDPVVLRVERSSTTCTDEERTLLGSIPFEMPYNTGNELPGQDTVYNFSLVFYTEVVSNNHAGGVKQLAIFFQINDGDLFPLAEVALDTNSDTYPAFGSGGNQTSATIAGGVEEGDNEIKFYVGMYNTEDDPGDVVLDDLKVFITSTPVNAGD